MLNNKMTVERAGELKNIIILCEICWYLDGCKKPKDQQIRRYLNSLKQYYSTRTNEVVNKVITLNNLEARFKDFFQIIERCEFDTSES